MKRWALLVLVVGLAGCAADTGSGSGRTPKENERRADYQRLQGELDKLDRQVAKWRAKAREATGPLKADMNKAVHDLEQKRDEAARRLEELKNENKGNWEELKHGASKAFNDFKHALDNVHLRFDTK